jgi:hypothetical protein
MKMNPMRLAFGPMLALLLTEPAHADTPPTGDYLAWLQLKFPSTYGNPVLEATVWGDDADPDLDGCGNLMEFVTARDPNVSDAELGNQCRIEGNDLVLTYRETTAANPGVNWHGEWSQDLGFWVRAGVRRATLETHPGYRVIEARITRNREQVMSFRLRAER